MADAEPVVEEVEGKKKRSKKAIIIPLVVLMLGLGGGGYAFLGKKSSASAKGTTTTTKLGQIVRLAPLTLNLADGHVLKVGIALQMVEKPKEKELAAELTAAASAHASSSSDPTASPLGGLEAKALDQAINDLGNMTFEELSKPGGRLKAKDELSEKITEIYEHDVVKVYFTDFVMS